MSDGRSDERWKAVFGCIERLWAEKHDAYDDALKGNLHTIAATIGTESGWTLEQADIAVARWRVERQAMALVEAQRARFSAPMRDRWPSEAGSGDPIVDLNTTRRRVIRNIEDLIARFADRYGFSENAGVRQISDWLGVVRSLSGHRPKLSIVPLRQER